MRVRYTSTHINAGVFIRSTAQLSVHAGARDTTNLQRLLGGTSRALTLAMVPIACNVPVVRP
jgi:hypothetical protein